MLLMMCCYKHTQSVFLVSQFFSLAFPNYEISPFRGQSITKILPLAWNGCYSSVYWCECLLTDSWRVISCVCCRQFYLCLPFLSCILGYRVQTNTKRAPPMSWNWPNTWFSSLGFIVCRGTFFIVILGNCVRLYEIAYAYIPILATQMKRRAFA